MMMYYRAIGGYLAVNGCYGFYRGWNNLHNRAYHYNFNEPFPLYTQRFVNGLGGALLQTLPICLFYTLYRMEKRVRGMELTPEDYDF